MTKAKQYKHRSRVDIYEEVPTLKPKTDWGEVLGGIFIVVIFLALLSTCAG